jgi:hypothetical protein
MTSSDSRKSARSTSRTGRSGCRCRWRKHDVLVTGRQRQFFSRHPREGGDDDPKTRSTP